jgi:hypothetical protein
MSLPTQVSLRGIMKIVYKNLRDFPGWDLADEFLKGLISQYNSRNILEIGSGANPTLTLDFIKAQNLNYTTNDLDAGELQKANPLLKTLHFDFCSPELPANIRNSYDLVFSRMVNEHVRNGKQYYQNIYDVLCENGITCHCFSTLYSFPFLVNKIVPESISDALLSIFSPREQYIHAKFKAYYSWSRGPTKRMIYRFKQLGFEVIEYAGFFGHEYYKKRLHFLNYLERIKSDFLLSHFPNPYLTAYAYIILQKKSRLLVIHENI